MNTILVPITVEALVVNDRIRKSQNFQRWVMNYQNIDNKTSPMPEVFDSNEAAAWNNTPNANGVYLQWILPQALRKGSKEESEGKVRFPFVPNRWIVIRYSGPFNNRKAKAWIVESDYTDIEKGTSPYVFFNSDEKIEITRIGRKIEIDQWFEESNKELFLTALGPDDTTFSAYQPNNENVFSIHDPLEDISDEETLSYMVAGWYSDKNQDILNVAGKALDDILKLLDWQLNNAKSTEGQFFTSSFYHGMCYGVEWNKLGSRIFNNIPDDINLSVGNTHIDALTALMLDNEQTYPINNIKLLETFQYDLAALLDEPNGKQLLDEAIHDTTFSKINSGHKWIIQKSSDKSEQPGPVDIWTDPNLDPEWLSLLNLNQKDYENGLQELESLQRQLYNIWWNREQFDELGTKFKQRIFKLDDSFNNEKFDHEIERLKKIIYDKIRSVSEKLDALPNGTNESNFQNSVKQYGLSKSLPDDYALLYVTDGKYYQANDPVVLITGAKTSEPLTNLDKLVCRSEDQIIKGIVFQNKEINVDTIEHRNPIVNCKQVPAVIESLIEEFFFLDPYNAESIAQYAYSGILKDSLEDVKSQMYRFDEKDFIGNLPVIKLSEWNQPWQPLFLMWKIRYFPIPYENNWQFDGQRFARQMPRVTSEDQGSFTISGTTIVTPQSSFNFIAKINEFIAKNNSLGDAHIEQFEKLITEVSEWDLLSQSLDGFTAKLLCLDSNLCIPVPKSSEIGRLMGRNKFFTPITGPLPEAFASKWPVSNFQTIRSGQFRFENLSIVDRFGQSAEICNPENYQFLRPFKSPDLIPQAPVRNDNPHCLIELQPRILQPAKLSFRFLEDKPDSNPVYGWFIVNYMDKNLGIYDCSGALLGTLKIVETLNSPVVQWEKSVHSVYNTIGDLKSDHPKLEKILSGITNRGVEAFQEFCECIDNMLWNINPTSSRDGDNLSILAGRPLAITGCSLKLELKEKPLKSPGWQYTFKQAPADLLKYKFPIKLGDPNNRNDGLIGFFINDNYNKFYCETTVKSQSFTDEIDVNHFIPLTFDDASQTDVIMIIDPRAPIHAKCGLLPQETLEIPAKYIEPAIECMEVTFNMGVLFTSLEKMQSDENKNFSVLIPEPFPRKGKWTWLEPMIRLGSDEKIWNEFDIAPVDDTLVFKENNLSLHSGILMHKLKKE